MTFNASVVINFHREGLLATPTLNSLLAAKSEAEKAGHRVEFVAVADRSNAETDRVLEKFAHIFDQNHRVSFGDLGASREFGIQQTSSDWVFMHDADDLFSSNWYRVFLDRLAAGEVDPNTVYHTDIFARFGVEIDARKMIDSADPRFHPLMQASEWYFSNKAVLNRNLLKRFPMPKNDIRRGIGNEDWTWASHTIAAGIRRTPLPETICFYRTKTAMLSLGLTPGMIHDASELYAPENVIKLAVQRAESAQKISGFATSLVGRADPVIGEGPLPEWFWSEVARQGAFESLITEFSAIRPHFRCYLPNLHFNVVSAVEYLMKDMDTRPKIFIFASAGHIRGADNVIDLFLRAAARYDAEHYQPVLVLDEGPLVPSDMRIMATFGAKLIAVEHLRRYFKLEDWYFNRTLLRPLIQFKNSIIIDLCSDTFALLFKEFHKVLVENFVALVPILLDRAFDLLSPSIANLTNNAKFFVHHTKHALPIVTGADLAAKLACNADIQAMPAPEPAITALRAVTLERFRTATAPPPELDLAPLIDLLTRAEPAAVAAPSAVRIICDEVLHQGRKYYFYHSTHAWISADWLATATAFLFKNQHLAICAPQITLSRKADGQAQARWHNYSDAAHSFAATYEQVASGQNVPIVAVVRSRISEHDITAPAAFALALANYCAADPKRLASACGESVALFCPPEHVAEALPISTETAKCDIYWQCYEDLISIHARGYWSLAQIEKHYTDHGIAEGRKIPDASALEPCWSDSLFFATQSDGYKWWWDKGVLETAAWRAANDPYELLSYGAIPENTDFQARTALSPGALRLVAEFDNQHLAVAYLPQLRYGRLEWAEHKVIGIVALLASALALKATGITDVIIVPALESGGAELVALWHYRAAEAAGRKPLIILSDTEVITPRFEAENLNILNIPSLISAAADAAFAKLPLAQRITCLCAAIECLEPQTTHIIHAFSAYQALGSTQVAARLRAASGRIYVSAFCPHIHPDGRHDGYFREIPTITQYVDRFIFDNIWFADQMRQTYGLDDDKIETIAYPIDMIAPVLRAPDSAKNVLWASRLDAQKNPQIIGEIARALPDVTFHVYGRAVLDDTSVDWSKMPENVIAQGPFYGVDSLPFAQMDAFLYTSRFDGMPNILLEIAARGLPIVTAPIGGIPEFLGPDWPLYAETPDDVAGFCAALKLVLDSDTRRQSCIDAQISFLRRNRNVAHFLKTCAPLYCDLDKALPQQ